MNHDPNISALESLTLDNAFTRDLPGDPDPSNTRRQVSGACYSRVVPTAVTKPELIAYAPEVGQLLGLDPNLDPYATPGFAEVFSGNRLLPGMDPFAMCYGGHQFGNWAGQLGDGRAINLADVVNDQTGRWTLQLKGAGPTPYSRTADGLAVLRSSVREFLCSEAMHHLGVPTTRALSLVATGEDVLRDMFYDGHPRLEPGAVVCRVAPSFTRFGNFQIFTARGDIETLRKLVDYTIQTDFSHLGEPSPEVYLEWFAEVCRTTAAMIVQWMRVGFVHGVMNTDNMSILGLTIDYGPYGWLDDYDPNWTPNTTDAQGRRYRFAHQPQIAHWNLAQLANAIVPLFQEIEPLQAALDRYVVDFEQGWEAMMAAKLGLETFQRERDEPLIRHLLEILQLAETDMTIFFRRLAAVSCDSDSGASGTAENQVETLREAYYSAQQFRNHAPTKLVDWIRSYQARVQAEGTPDEVRRRRMNQVNPKYVLRNYLAQQAIDRSEQGDHQMIHELLDLMRRPYDEQPERESYAARRPDWARDRAGCSMLSCSS